jgi:flavin reductase (DIM6/NTAB) family NADH-FMN oxidoreductase RutF
MGAIDMAHLTPPPLDNDVQPMSTAPSDAESASFRLAMREFASGVAILTCVNGGVRAGCTATALASLSLEPPSLVVCLERSSATLASLREAGAFAVNILAAQHGALAARFSGRGGIHGEARFEVGDWLPLVTGAPALADALASIDCRVEEILERHTHAIVIGAVQAVRLGAGTAGLLHWRSRFETSE